MAFMASIRGLGVLFYILLGFRYSGFCFTSEAQLLVSLLIMENQMERKMKYDMETAIYRAMYGIIGFIV